MSTSSPTPDHGALAWCAIESGGAKSGNAAHRSEKVRRLWLSQIRSQSCGVENGGLNPGESRYLYLWLPDRSCRCPAAAPLAAARTSSHRGSEPRTTRPQPCPVIGWPKQVFLGNYTPARRAVVDTMVKMFFQDGNRACHSLQSNTWQNQARRVKAAIWVFGPFEQKQELFPTQLSPFSPDVCSLQLTIHQLPSAGHQLQRQKRRVR